MFLYCQQVKNARGPTMKLVHEDVLIDNRLSLMLLENDEEIHSFTDVRPLLTQLGILITCIITKNKKNDKMGIIKILHQGPSIDIFNYLKDIITKKKPVKDLQLSKFLPKSNHDVNEWLQNILITQCQHLELMSAPFLLVPSSPSGNEWLVLSKDDFKRFAMINILTDDELFINQLVHRIMTVLHLEQLQQITCKEVVMETDDFSKKRKNLLVTIYPKNLLDLNSLLHFIHQHHDLVDSILPLKEFFNALGRMQFYCYWLGINNLKECITIDLEPFKPIMSRPKSFHLPLSNSLLLNTYQTIETILKAEPAPPLNLDEAWKEFRSGMHLEAARLQRLLLDDDTKKELTFLLKAYQHALRFPSSHLERMFEPITWFKVY